MKINFSYLYSFFLFLLWFSTQGQEMHYQDQIFLDNGGRIVGQIIKYDFAKEAVIEFENGNQVAVPADRIRKVYMFKRRYRHNSRDYSPLLTGHYFQELQFSFMNGITGLGYSATYDFLYQRNQFLSYGMGTGFDSYTIYNPRSIMPIYLHTRVNLRKGFAAPFIGMKAGYGFAFRNESNNITDAQGGGMWNPHMGIRIGTRGLIVNLLAGVKFQKARYIVENPRNTRNEDFSYRRLQLAASVMF